MNILKDNLKQNCIPKSVFDMYVKEYRDFINQRRGLMANKIEHYCKNLWI